MRQKPQLGKVLEAMRDDGVEAVMEAREVEGFDGCSVAVDVILKVLAE